MSRERRNAQRIVKELRGWGAEEVSVVAVGDSFEFRIIVRTGLALLKLTYRESFAVLANLSADSVSPITEKIYLSWSRSADGWKDSKQHLLFLGALGL